MITALFVLFVLLSVADAVTTYHALQRTGTREANPLMRWLFEHVGTVPALVATKGAAIAAVWLTMGPYSLWVLAAINAFYAVVAWRNHYRVGPMIQVLIAIDQLFNALLNGMADETLSARAFRRELQGRSAVPRLMIDALFFWQPNHCYHAWRAEIERRQLPSQYLTA